MHCKQFGGGSNYRSISTKMSMQKESGVRYAAPQLSDLTCQRSPFVERGRITFGTACAWPSVCHGLSKSQLSCANVDFILPICLIAW